MTSSRSARVRPPRVPVAEAVRGQPFAHMAPVLGAARPRLPHALAEDLHLRAVAGLASVLARRRALGLERQTLAALAQHLVRRQQERQHAAEAHVGHRLVHQLLQRHGLQAHRKRGGRECLERLDALAAHERGQYGQKARAVIKVAAAGALGVHHLVEREVGEQLHELGIGLVQGGRASGIQLLAVRPCGLGDSGGHAMLLFRGGPSPAGSLGRKRAAGRTAAISCYDSSIYPGARSKSTATGKSTAHHNCYKFTMILAGSRRLTEESF